MAVFMVVVYHVTPKRRYLYLNLPGVTSQGTLIYIVIFWVGMPCCLVNSEFFLRVREPADEDNTGVRNVEQNRVFESHSLLQYD